MTDRIEDLAQALSRLPGIGPRQARRFVYHLLSTPSAERAKLAELILSLGKEVRQCSDCLRYMNEGGTQCKFCSDTSRDDSSLMVLEKDQDLLAIERASAYKGRYFVLGGVLTLSGKGVIREKELTRTVEKRLAKGLKEIVLALSATSEGEHTVDRVQELLKPYRDRMRISILGRGLATGSELEYSDAETLRAALSNRTET